MKVKLLTLLADILKTAVTRKIDMTTVVIQEVCDNQLIYKYHLAIHHLLFVFIPIVNLSYKDSTKICNCHADFEIFNIKILTEPFVYYHIRITFHLSRTPK